MAETNEQRIERILEKLSQARKKKLSCFGSESHNFRLNAPIEESALLLFESTHGVTLPADYRCFLRRAGNGGAGPYYGIYKLDQWKDFIDWTTDDPPNNILALPSPLYPQIPRDTDWETQFANCFSPYQGMISLGTQGCTYMMGLIVTGEFAGRVVYLDADGQAPYVVREPDFLAWYERWLDELLGSYDMFWFGYGLGGDEATLLALLEDSSTSSSDRVEAIYAIRRLPTLSTTGQQKICQVIDDDVPEVRAAACSVIEKFEIAEAQASLSKLLHDESAEVQKAAVGASMKLRGNDANDEVTRLLESADEGVAERAFFRLKDNGTLPREVLLRLVQSSPHGSIRYCAAHAVEWKTQDEGLLIRLLKDDHPQVRFYAVLGLRQIGSRASLGAVIDLLSWESNHHTIDSILRMLGEVPGERNADVLLKWTKADDDFYRLTAVDGLCKLGDLRVESVAQSLLDETRPPMRRDANGLSVMSNVKSIRKLVGESLRASPNRYLRRLVSPFRWPTWLTFRDRSDE
jgi:HEAT repeat protein